MQTQLFGATAAVFHYFAVSRAMGTVAVKWLKVPRPGYFDVFGAVAAESVIKGALAASTELNGNPGVRTGENGPSGVRG